MLQRKLRRQYKIVEIRLHRQKKLMQRIFYQTSSQQIGGNKCSSDSSTVRLHVHQKKPLASSPTCLPLLAPKALHLGNRGRYLPGLDVLKIDQRAVDILPAASCVHRCVKGEHFCTPLHQGQGRK